jgi:3'-5' exoribonuclease
MFVNEFEDGAEIDQVLAVREVERWQKRNGEGDYLRLMLGDRTGAVVSMVWDEIGPHERLAKAGEAVHVNGRYTVHPRFGPQINLRALSEAVPGSYEPEDLRDGPAMDVEQLEAQLRELVETVRQPHLKELLDRALGDGSPLWERYRNAPAAKRYHQAYRHGLLEHSLSVAEAVSATSATFGGIDRDVAVTGALLHDIGKLDAYTEQGGDGAIELTDEGRLQGEIALGYYRVQRLIEEIDGFQDELAQAITHIVLSHHGSLEHGSPVVPCTREAMLVHMIDNLGGRLGSFDRLEKELAPGSRWSSYDRALQTSAFFGGSPAQATAPAQAATPAGEPVEQALWAA